MEESVKKVELKIEKGYRSNEMEGRCESDRGGDEVYPATFGNEDKTGLKLDKRKRRIYTIKKYKKKKNKANKLIKKEIKL